MPLDFITTVGPPRYFGGPASALRLSPTSAAIVALFGAALLVLTLGYGRVLTYHEVVFAEPAREMLATGNFVVPRLGGIPFTDKPPLTAWCIAASMTLFGSESEWVVRLPSALAAIATALIVAGLAARWFGNRFGLVAGLVQLTTVHVLTQARLGECDTLLAATVAAAFGSFAVANVDAGRGRSTWRGWPLVFHLACGASFLVKGLVGPALIGTGCLAYLLYNRDLHGLRFLFDPRGLIVSAACVVPWLAAAYAEYPGIVENMVFHHFGRLRGQLGEREPPLAYWYLVPLMMLPWTPLVARAVWIGWRSGHAAHETWRFLLAWFLPGMALLSLSAFKARHYAIPLLPPLAIMATAGLLDYLAGRWRARHPRHGMLAAAIVLGGTLAVALIESRVTRQPHVLAMLATVAGCGLLAAVWFEHRRQIARELAAMFATVLFVAWGVQLFVMPAHDSYRPQTELAQRVNRLVPAHERLYMLHLPENQITYYLSASLTRIDDESLFLEGPARTLDQPVFILAPRHLAERLASLGQAEVLDRCHAINSYMTERDRLTLLRWQPLLLAAKAESPPK